MPTDTNPPAPPGDAVRWLDQLPVLAWTTDRDLRITALHGAALAGLGFSAADVVGRHLADLNPALPDDAPVFAAHARALAGGTGGTFEPVYAGRRYHALVEPLRDASGEIVGCAGLAIALEPAGLVEARLRFEAAALPLLLDATAALAATRTNRDALAAALTHICAYTGWEVGHGVLLEPDGDGPKIATDVWYDLPGARAAVGDVLPLRRASGGARLPAAPDLAGLTLAAGAPLWAVDLAAAGPAVARHAAAVGAGLASGSAVPVRSGHGLAALLEFFATRAQPPDSAAAEAVEAVAAELGRALERQRARRLVASSARLFGALFDAAPDVTILVDAQGVVRQANRQVQAIFGYEPAELVGEPVECLVPERFRDAPLAFRATYEASPTLRPMGQGLELYARHKSGAEFPVEITVSPLPWRAETWTICSVRDIRQRVRLEVDLAEAHRQVIRQVELERVALAQEIHDGPLQDLYATRFHLQAAGEDAEDPEALRRQLGAARRALRQVSDDLRRVCTALRPPVLEPFGLAAAIRAHAEALATEVPELDVHLALEAVEVRLPEAVEITLYRIYQQAMHNVVRHARARHVAVRLAADAERLTLEVTDDGVGFALPDDWPAFARQGHLGILGMFERAQGIDATMAVDSSPGAGTSVHVSVPR